MYDYPIEKLPLKGFVLAYFKESLVYEPYEVIDGKIIFDGSEILEKEIPREAHFYDAHTEYRMVRRQSRNDVIELVLTESEELEMDPDLIFVEDVLIKRELAALDRYPDKIRVVNRYRFSEYDTLVLKNYRIAESQ